MEASHPTLTDHTKLLICLFLERQDIGSWNTNLTMALRQRVAWFGSAVVAKHADMNQTRFFLRHLCVDTTKFLHDSVTFGRVDILRELRDWDVGEEDARKGCPQLFAQPTENWTLGLAAMFGHVDVLRELGENWNLGPEDARSGNDFAFRMACRHGHVGVLRELQENWDVGDIFVPSTRNYVIKWASINAHIDVLRELRDRWDFTEADARARHNLAFSYAVQFGGVLVLRELGENWNLGPADAEDALSISDLVPLNDDVRRELNENWSQ